MRVITEDPANDLVDIDGAKISGWVEVGTCNRCSSRLVYHERFDSLFCPQCNSWVSSRCSDPACGYCPGRPERPLGG